MNKKEKLQFEKLKNLLEAEKKRADTSWNAYTKVLYEMVDLETKLKAINEVLNDGL